MIGAEVEEQLGRFLAGRIELRAHLCRIVIDVAAALSLHLGTQLGLFKVGICQEYLSLIHIWFFSCSYYGDEWFV